MREEAQLKSLLLRLGRGRVAPGDLAPQTRLAEDLGLDSMQFISLVLESEAALGRRIFSIDRLPLLRTVGDLLQAAKDSPHTAEPGHA